LAPLLLIFLNLPFLPLRILKPLLLLSLALGGSLALVLLLCRALLLLPFPLLRLAALRLLAVLVTLPLFPVLAQLPLDVLLLSDCGSLIPPLLLQDPDHETLDLPPLLDLHPLNKFGLRNKHAPILIFRLPGFRLRRPLADERLAHAFHLENQGIGLVDHRAAGDLAGARIPGVFIEGDLRWVLQLLRSNAQAAHCFDRDLLSEGGGKVRTESEDGAALNVPSSRGRTALRLLQRRVIRRVGLREARRDRVWLVVAHFFEHERWTFSLDVRYQVVQPCPYLFAMRRPRLTFPPGAVTTVKDDFGHS
jgi:hypothetical protein